MTSAWIAAYATLAAVVVLLTVLVVGILRRTTFLIERVESHLATREAGAGGLPVGTVVPHFSTYDAQGQIFTAVDLTSQTVVLFLSSSCAPCETFNRDLERGLAPSLGSELVIVTGDAEQAKRIADASHVRVVLNHERVVSDAFQNAATPQAFVLDESRRVLATGTPNDWQLLRLLLPEPLRGGDRVSDVAAAVVAS